MWCRQVSQFWVADANYIAIAVGFVDRAVILDAWSRCVVGYLEKRGESYDNATAASFMKTLKVEKFT